MRAIGGTQIHECQIGEISQAGLITQAQLVAASSKQSDPAASRLQPASRWGSSEEDINPTLAEQYGTPAINLRHFEIDESGHPPGAGRVAEVPDHAGQPTGQMLTTDGGPTNVFRWTTSSS